MSDESKYVSFFVCNEEYIINVTSVKQITRPGEFRIPPNLPYFFAGVESWRGQVLSIIDLAKLFNLESSAIEKKLVIVEMGEKNFGLLVDRVNRIENISDEWVSAVPLSMETERNRFIDGIASLDDGARLVMKISLSRLEELIVNCRSK
ncbi:MAG: chemotaxis protein CheW [Candidatus Riflebacteria bacterium]|nr:chemotaxis protein CheW [Candidatus Riflebacteria bacterium]